MKYCGKCGTQNQDDNLFCEKCGHRFSGTPVEESAKREVSSPAKKPGESYPSGLQEISGYRIVEEIGRGGMGVVFLGENPLLEKKVAIKALSSELTKDERFRERFFKEAKAQARLIQRNIAQIENFHEYQGNYYLIMEYVPGRGLDEIIREKGRLEEQEALDLFKQVLQGLSYAHSNDVIHRDIKPSNIRVTPKGKVKIMDFGIALMIGEKRITRTGTTIGTPEYMSPEQIKSPKEMDHRSDIYSAGIVLYEMLTGDTPFQSDTDSDYDIKEQQVHTTPPDPKNKNPEISITLAQIILKAIEKSPDDRYAGCEEFLRFIKAYEIGEDKAPIQADVVSDKTEESYPKVEISTCMDEPEIVKPSMFEMIYSSPFFSLLPWLIIITVIFFFILGATGLLKNW